MEGEERTQTRKESRSDSIDAICIFGSGVGMVVMVGIAVRIGNGDLLVNCDVKSPDVLFPTPCCANLQDLLFYIPRLPPPKKEERNCCSQKRGRIPVLSSFFFSSKQLNLNGIHQSPGAQSGVHWPELRVRLFFMFWNSTIAPSLFPLLFALSLSVNMANGSETLHEFTNYFFFFSRVF